MRNAESCAAGRFAGAGFFALLAAVVFSHAAGLGAGALQNQGRGKPAGQSTQETIDPLPPTTGYLLTGDYVAGSVDLQGGTGGIASGTIPISGVPANSDIYAAFLYWESIDLASRLPNDIAANVTFRGQSILGARVKSTSKPLNGATAPCYSSGAPLSMTMFRADVLKLLPPLKDMNGRNTGKLVVNDADLVANGLPLHAVSAPEYGTGNRVPQTAGFTLVVVYRDPNPDRVANPLRKIVVHDGLHLQRQGEVTIQNIRGFYKSDPNNPKAKITHIVGSGAPNSTDTLTVTTAPGQTVVVSNPFPATSKASDRSWTGLTVDVSTKMPGTDYSDGYGETIRSEVKHVKDAPYDCLTWAGTWASFSVLNTDGDSIPDGLEVPGGPLKDPDGTPLPNLYAMGSRGPGLDGVLGNADDIIRPGARTNQKDVFIELLAMKANPGTKWGSATAPYDSGLGSDGVANTADDGSFIESVTDFVGHNHMPTPEVVRLFAEALERQNVRVHVDAGNLSDYHALGADYASLEAEEYLIADPLLARGGEISVETACSAADPTCRFPDFPGTLAYGFSVQRYLLGLDIDPNGHQPRFDKNRYGLFHVLVNAHMRGKVKSPATVDQKVPGGSSGFGLLPGFLAVETFGRWENFVGTPLVRANTWLHEWAHNVDIWHGGPPPTFTRTASGVVREGSGNCKPHHISAVNYLYQILGLLHDDQSRRVDLSGAAHGTLNENGLSEAALTPAPGYRPAWYVPIVPNSLAQILGVPAAKDLCTGGTLPPSYQNNPMGRFEAPNTTAALDWNTLASLTSSQDINLDGTLSNALQGYNDWANVKLDQGGAGYAVGSVSKGGEDYGGEDYGGEDYGGEDYGGEDYGGVTIFGGQDSGGEDYGGLDFDGEDYGGKDVGGEDYGGDGELDHVTAVRMLGNTGGPPTELKACVLGGNVPAPREGAGTPVCAPIHQRPDVSSTSPLHRTRLSWKWPNLLPIPAHPNPIQRFRVFRVTGGTVDGTSTPVEIATPTPAEAGCSTSSQVCTVNDAQEPPDTQRFTYFARVDFSDTETDSGPSNFATIRARNDAPVAVADAVSTNEDVAVAGNVLANDHDADSLLLGTDGRGPVLVSGTANGALVFNADGSFGYTPNPNFSGADAFTYKIIAGTFSGPPPQAPQKMSSPNESGVVAVTIRVYPVNDAPIADSKAVSTNEDAALAVALTGTDIETNPANLTATITQAPAKGTLTGIWPNYTYTPAANANGPDSFKFTVTDRGDPDGCAGGLPDCSATLTSAEATVSITVVAVNDAPAGTDGSVTTLEDVAHTFTAATFGFTDPVDALPIAAGGPNAVAGVRITTLPAAGTLKKNSTAVLAGEEITAADLAAGNLKFTPAANANGSAYATFTFQVRDNGGTANGGVDLDQSPNTLTINVTAVNDPPAGADGTVTMLEDTDFAFAAANFGFSDPKDATSTAGANLLAAVKITTLPLAGSLTRDGLPVGAGQEISAGDIVAGKLTFRPAPDGNGPAYTAFTFQVRDDGGTGNSGVDLDPSPNTFSINVTPVNDAPSFTKGADQTVAEDAGPRAVEGWATNFSPGPANESTQTVLAYKVVSNTNPSLFSAGPAIDNTGKLTYTPAPNANGSATIGVTVRDSGGTGNGGVDTSAAQTFTITVTEVNDPPTAATDTKVTNEDTPLTFPASDLTANDSPGPTNESGQSLTFTLVTAGPNGTASLTDGMVTFTPKPNFNGLAVFTYKVWDDGTTIASSDPRSATGTVSVTVRPVNDKPAAAGGTEMTPENTSRAITLKGDDVETSPANLSFGIGTPPANGTLSGVAPNVVYTPNAGYLGQDSFTFTVTDRGDPDNCGTPIVNACTAARTSIAATVSITVKNQAVFTSQPTVAGAPAAVYLIDLDTGLVDTSLAHPQNFIDIAVTPDHRTALVTAFSPKKVRFLDLTTTPPTLTGTLDLPMAAEDVDISADGRYAVVADGTTPESTIVVSIDVATRQIVTKLTLPVKAQGIAFVPNRPIVLVNAFLSGVVRVLSIAADGSLSDTGTSVAAGASPINVQPSPDGGLALVPNFSGSGTVSIVRIAQDGTVTAGGSVAPASGKSLVNAQSVAFAPDSSRAYVMLTGGEVAVLDIDGAQNVTDSGIRVGATGDTGFGYFGVDQITATGNGKYVVVHQAGQVSVIDRSTNTIVRTRAVENDAGAGGIAIR